jgi:hypothetical protein
MDPETDDDPTCDVVLKGGITSGVLYPTLLCEWQRSSCGLPAPSSRANRPADTWCRLVASMAMVAGLRPQTFGTPVPRRIRLVRTATSVSSTAASWPHPSAN